jgi:hypothetical protein
MSMSGAYLSVTIGASPAVLSATQEWTFEEESEELDRTAGADEGYGNRDGGVLDATVTMRMFFDTSTGTMVPVRARTVLTDLMLYSHQDNPTPDVEMPSALVVRASKPVKVRGGCYIDVTAKNKGAYTVNK